MPTHHANIDTDPTEEDGLPSDRSVAVRSGITKDAPQLIEANRISRDGATRVDATDTKRCTNANSIALPDVGRIRKTEAERRFSLLSETVAVQAYNNATHDQLRARARLTKVSLRVLVSWKHAYDARGIDGLLPDWDELDSQTWVTVTSIHQQLTPVADAVEVTDATINDLAQRNKWSMQKTKRWLKRYRTGGLLALAPDGDPDKQWRLRRTVVPRSRRPPRNLAVIKGAELEATLSTIFHNHAILGDLANREHLSNKEVYERAKETGVSERTLRYLHADYKAWGMQGLAHRERSDARHSTLSDRMEGIITYVRLTNKDATYRFIREKAGERARKIGESEPSDWQIRYVLDRIPKAVLALADGRENKFRNGSRITFLLTYDGSEIVIQVDWTLVDVLVKDLRQPGVRSPSGETRLYLLRAKECSSRGSPAARFLYDRPNKFDVAALIRDVLIRSERNPFGGKFNRLDVDNGPELISDMVQFICAELHIDMPRDSPRHPEGRARAERDFGMLNTRLWSTLLGYVNSNTTARNPSAKAVLTPMELEDKYWEFMAIYHNEPQEELGGKTPIEFYHEHCFAEPVDPRLLDTLLLEPVDRVVRKEGIQLDNRIYWHENLGDIVNQPVLVRAAPAYKAPDEIEVFYDGTWFCTAVAIDSPKGRAIPREQIAAAQHTQRRRIKGRIAHARASLVAIDREIEFGEVAHAENVEEGPSPASSAKPVTIDPSSGMNMVTMPKDLASKPAKDWLDRMNDHTIS